VQESSKNAVSNGHPDSHPALVEKRPPLPQPAAATPTTRMKLGFKDRSWTEIEKIWRGKAREPPSIETLLKPQSNYRSKDRQTRARTLPFTATSTTAASSGAMTTSVSVAHLGSAVRSASGSAPRWPPPARQALQKSASVTSASSRLPPKPTTTTSLLAAHSQSLLPPALSLGRMESPLQTRKAVDLMAPHVLNTWQSKDFRSLCVSFDAESASSIESQEEEEDEEKDHFVELVKAW
jgi:hypothetical protein